MHTGPANHVVNDGGSIFFGMDTNAGSSYEIIRGGLSFDASALPAGFVVDSVTLDAYALYKYDDRGDCMNIVTYTPASYSTAVGADFDQFGTTKYATDVPISSITTNSNNTFTFISAGNSAITAGVFGLGLRSCNDIADSAGPNSAYSSGVQFDDQTTAHPPELTITYHVPASSSSSSSSSAAPSASGSLILFHSICQAYTALSATSSGSITDYSECGSWDTSIEIPAMNAIRRQYSAIVYSAIVLVIHWSIRLFLILVLSRWLYRILTKYRKNRTVIVRRSRPSR